MIITLTLTLTLALTLTPTLALTVTLTLTLTLTLTRENEFCHLPLPAPPHTKLHSYRWKFLTGFLYKLKITSWIQKVLPLELLRNLKTKQFTLQAV
jgi:hypothetical protein